MENCTVKEKTKKALLPVVPLRGRVAFPHLSISFEIGRESTMLALARAESTEDKLLILCTQRKAEQENITEADFYDSGCVARVKQVSRTSGSNVVRVLCECLYRAKIDRVQTTDGFFSALAEEITPIEGEYVLQEAHLRTVKALVKDVLAVDGKMGRDTAAKLEEMTNADEYVDVAAAEMRLTTEVKQQILIEADVVKRLRLLERSLNDELEISKVERKIAQSVRTAIDKGQKDYFFREQIKAIRTELGEDGKDADIYREKILAKGMPKEAEEKCLTEADRLLKTAPSSPEYAVITNYLDQVLALPWTERTEDTENVADCAAVLDADHYGMEKIKDRIVEYLAVLQLKKDMKAPILCFVGPPGVGKTSIARSIARSLGRKFVRMSLGGVRDEAEIRGHRRTYVGAMPGRIVSGMKIAGSINPVFLLDEIDKMTFDIHGDPAAALLEALDPEQNGTFGDRFLEIPYDLSKVLFITTANSTDTIPTPLLDRMEIVQLSGYTLEEKTEIAKRYLVPKQCKENGLTEENVRFTTDALQKIAEGYTREAGVRSLERTVGTVCRKIAVEFATGKRKTQAKVRAANVEKRLGAPRFVVDENALLPQVGAVNGLAWTAVGGTTLTVEAVVAEGKGDLRLTGQLGDVMKESAQAAWSYLRAHASEYGLTKDDFTKKDLHVHVPEGATPKDGPSAGVTMATAMLSALTGASVRGDVAMTGEITLRGKVLPIGGLKEKALAARRVGIKTVLMPVGNVKDLQDLPQVLKRDLRFVPVSCVDEVFREAVLRTEEKREEVAAECGATLPITPRPRPADGVRCEG